MALWNEDGLNTGRVLAIEQAALGRIKLSDIAPLDEEEQKFFDDTLKEIKEAKERGTEYPIFSIPQM